MDGEEELEGPWLRPGVWVLDGEREGVEMMGRWEREVRVFIMVVGLSRVLFCSFCGVLVRDLNRFGMAKRLTP